MSRVDASQDTLKAVRCAVYTRKSTEEGLEQEFNTLDAQRESAEAYIVSQQHEGWTRLRHVRLALLMRPPFNRVREPLALKPLPDDHHASGGGHQFGLRDLLQVIENHLDRA